MRRSGARSRGPATWRRRERPRLRGLPVCIRGTASLLPGRPVSTRALAQAALPDRDPAELEARTGITTRYWADRDAPLPELAADALGRAIADAGVAPAALRRIIVANCTGAELAFPGSANRVAEALGLSGRCDAFDVNNACMGFLTALDLAARTAATGGGPVGVVAIELCSRHVRPEDPRPYLVFADGVGAAVVDAARGGARIVASYLANDGALGGNAILRNPTLTGKPEFIEFPKSHAQMTEIALGKVQAAADAVLMQAGLRIGDVDWVLPHQPNGSMYAHIVEALGVDPARTVKIVDEVGSVGSASIPISLDRLRRTRGWSPGQHVLMVGVGSGVSYGAILYRVGT
jgi:3-oxoacyl-[acyl-carrier-protein] synthase-3